MMRTEKIDEIINGAGYGIGVPEDKESRFKIRRLVEHVYKQGIIDGKAVIEKVESLKKEWSEKPHPATMHKADEKFYRKVCFSCDKPFNAYLRNDSPKGWCCDRCMIDPRWKRSQPIQN